MRIVLARLSLYLLLCVAARTENIRITGGIVDDQVLQRSSDGRADLRLNGTAHTAEGQPVEARVLRRFEPVKGLDWHVISRVKGGSWAGEIKGVPTGGPYRIEVRTDDSLEFVAVDRILIGDLWLLGGQSNMRGLGEMVNVEQPHPLVHTFDMLDRWLLAEEPLHGMGGGLGLPFAREMLRRTGVPIGLIPCAIGSTSMDLWAPEGAQKPLTFFAGAYHAPSPDLLPRELREKGSNSLYEAMLRRYRGAGGKIKGMLWYQGESDSSVIAMPLFQQKFERFVTAVRRDFAQPDLPFYYVQIAHHANANTGDEWNQVQEIQRNSESRIPHSAMAVAVDLELDDPVHIGTEGHKRLGLRLAKLACRDLFPAMNECGALKRGPRPLSATRDKGLIRVLFSETNGSLRASERISGFSIHAPQQQVVPLIYKARVDPASGNIVLLYFQGNLPAGAHLHYGYGTDPYCNLTDEADMGVPAFGPIAIQ